MPTEKTPPPSYCQCADAATGKQCKNHAIDGDVFCSQHVGSCPMSAMSGFEPEYAPDLWNADPARYLSMNCYAYAMMFQDPKLIEECRKNNHKGCRRYFPQPGALNGLRNALNAESRRSCPVVEKLMMADIPALEKSDYHTTCPKGKSKIAMVVSPGKDYHFYRQDKNGFWSHKDGSNKVKNFDANKRRIFNPEYAARDYQWQGSDLNYTDFCGFYCAPRDVPVHLGQGGRRRRSLRRPARTRRQKQVGGHSVPSKTRKRRSPRFGLAWA